MSLHETLNNSTKKSILKNYLASLASIRIFAHIAQYLSGIINSVSHFIFFFGYNYNLRKTIGTTLLLNTIYVYIYFFQYIRNILINYLIYPFIVLIYILFFILCDFNTFIILDVFKLGNNICMDHERTIELALFSVLNTRS